VPSHAVYCLFCVIVFDALLIVFSFQCFDAVVGWQEEGYPACEKLNGGCWHGYVSGSRCRFAYYPVNRDWFYLPGSTFLVPAHPGSPGQNPRVC